MIGLQVRRTTVDDHTVPTLHDLLANNVRGERARRRWTQAQLAEMLGWPRTAIHDIEIGKRRLGLDDLSELCRIFDLPLVELCRGADLRQLRYLGLG